MSRSPQKTIRITPSMLVSSSNRSVKESIAEGWLIAHEDHSLYSLLKDVNRGGFKILGKDLKGRFTQEELAAEDAKNPQRFIQILRDELKLTGDEITALSGYSQRPNGFMTLLFNTGNKYYDFATKTERLTPHNWTVEITRDEKTGHLVARMEQSFKYNNADNEISSAQLPPAVVTMRYRPDGSGPVLQYLEIPSLYAPLLFANGTVDFKQWYKLTDNQPVTFFRPKAFRIPGMLLGFERNEERSLDFSNDELKKPVGSYIIDALYNGMCEGSFQFASVPLPPLPEPPDAYKASKRQVSFQERQRVVSDYFEAFLKTLPADFKLRKGDKEFGFDEKERLFRALLLQFNEIREKKRDCIVAYDSVAKEFVFGASKPYETSQGLLIEQQIQRMFTFQASEKIRVTKPQEKAFRVDRSDDPKCALEVKMHDSKESVKENTVYVYWKDKQWFAFYVDPKGIKHDAVKIQGADDTLLSKDLTVRDSKVQNLKIVEKATYSYRLQAWQEKYLHSYGQDYRRYAVKTIAQPLFTALGSKAGHNADFGLYDQDEISSFSLAANEGQMSLMGAYLKVVELRNALLKLGGKPSNEDITDEEWERLLKSLQDKKVREAISKLETDLPEPKTKQGNPRQLVRAFSNTINELLRFNATNTPVGFANKDALENAWMVDLTVEERNTALNAIAGRNDLDVEAVNQDVIKAINRISQALVEDPRLLLLFSKHNNINQALVQEWDTAYSVLEGADYTKLDTLNERLVLYAKAALKNTNSARQKYVAGTLSVAREALADIQTPDLMRGSLVEIEAALIEELNYLREVGQLRQETRTLANLPEFRNQNQENLTLKPRDSNLELQRAILKSFKDANRPLPSRQELRQYAKLVTDTEAKVSRAKEFFLNYLQHVHGISKIDLPNLTDAAKKHPKIGRAVDALKYIEDFEEKHGNKDARKNNTLYDIKEYDAILEVLHNIKERNNDDHRFYQGNRFAKGFAVRSSLGTGGKKTVISLPSNGKQLPADYRKIMGLEEALGEKTDSIFPEGQSVFAPDLALGFEEFERNRFDERQKQRIWPRSFSKKESVLRNTASKEAVVRSGHWVRSIEAKLSVADSKDEIDAIERTVNNVLNPELADNDVQKLEKNVSRVRSAYQAKETLRREAHEFLKFAIAAQRLYIASKEESSKAPDAKALKNIQRNLSRKLDGLKISTSDKDLKPKYTNHIQFLKAAFKSFNAPSIERFQNAKQLYWNGLLEEVVNPFVDGMDKLSDYRKIAQAYDDAIRRISEIEKSESLGSSDQSSIKEEIVKILEGVAFDRMLQIIPGEGTDSRVSFAVRMLMKAKESAILDPRDQTFTPATPEREVLNAQQQPNEEKQQVSRQTTAGRDRVGVFSEAQRREQPVVDDNLSGNTDSQGSVVQSVKG